jgi:hypothetical protein
MDVPICQIRCFGFWSMCSATICSAKPSSTKPDDPIFEIEGSEISRSLDESSKTMTTNSDD